MAPFHEPPLPPPPPSQQKEGRSKDSRGRASNETAAAGGKRTTWPPATSHQPPARPGPPRPPPPPPSTQDHQHPHGRNANPHLEKRDNFRVRRAVCNLALATGNGNDSVLGAASTVHSSSSSNRGASDEFVRRAKVELEGASSLELRASPAPPLLIARGAGIRPADVGAAGVVRGRAAASRRGVFGPDHLHPRFVLVNDRIKSHRIASNDIIRRRQQRHARTRGNNNNKTNN